MRFRTTLCALAMFVVATSASAKETPQSVLDDAKALAKQGDALKAAARFGDAVAIAQAAGDGQAEEAAANALDEFIDDSAREADRMKVRAGQTSAVVPLGPILAAVMRKLDASRCGAYVSAPVLARNVLQCATETGDFASVGDAAKVAALANKPTSGKAAAVVALYADGMKAVAEGKFDAATGPLQTAAADALASGWFSLAAHASTELAATWMHLGAPDKAAAAIASAAAGFDEKSSPLLVHDWAAMLKTRLADAPPNVAKPVADLETKLPTSGTGGAGGAGGRGTPGRAGGAPPVSPIGALLPKLAKGKPFVSATRAAGGFEIHWITKPAEKPTSAFDEGGVTYEDDGGVRLGFHGRSACLLTVDLVGNKGAPGGRFLPGSGRAYYLLAAGETWSVAKDGVVTITR